MTDTASKTEGANSIVKDFAEGFSLQAKLANRTWVVLLTIIVINLQVPTVNDGYSVKSLPFGFGSLSSALVDGSLIFVFSFLTVYFCGLYSQALRIYLSAHATIDEMEDKEIQRRFFDVLAHPSLAKVGPLIFDDFFNTPCLSRFKQYQRLHYTILRGLASLVMFGIPLLGIVFSWWQMISNADVSLIVKLLGSILTVVAFFTLIQVFDRDRINFLRTRDQVLQE